MDIDDLTIRQVKELSALFGGGNVAAQPIDNGMIGKYVIVRCRAAGVHAGVLESHNGRECVLTEGRRLWYGKHESSQKFMSAVATDGLHKESKVGKTVTRIHLTENCELIQASSVSEASIRTANYDAN